MPVPAENQPTVPAADFAIIVLCLPRLVVEVREKLSQGLDGTGMAFVK
jgi:hypothetical protein